MRRWFHHTSLSTGLAAGLTVFALAGVARAAEATNVDEVIVTAQKRAENVQNVPQAVQVVSATQLAAAGVHYEGHRYLAHHGFANETAIGPRRIPITQYDAAWAQMAWDRTLRFFGHTLG